MLRSALCALFGNRCSGIDIGVPQICPGTGYDPRNTSLNPLRDALDDICTNSNGYLDSFYDSIRGEIIDQKLCHYCQYCTLLNEDVYAAIEDAGKEKGFCNAGDVGEKYTLPNSEIVGSFSDVSFCSSCAEIPCACAAAGGNCPAEFANHQGFCEDTQPVDDEFPPSWENDPSFGNKLNSCEQISEVYRNDDLPNGDTRIAEPYLRWGNPMPNQTCAEDEYGENSCNIDHVLSCKSVLGVLNAQQNIFKRYIQLLLRTFYPILDQSECKKDRCLASGQPPLCCWSEPATVPGDHPLETAMGCNPLTKDLPDPSTMSDDCICSICNGTDIDGQDFYSGGPPSHNCEECKDHDASYKYRSARDIIRELKQCIQCPVFNNVRRKYNFGSDDSGWTTGNCVQSSNTEDCECEYQENMCANDGQTPKDSGSAPGSPCSNVPGKSPPAWPINEWDPGSQEICYRGCRCTLENCQTDPNIDFSRCDCPPRDPGGQDDPGQCAHGRGCSELNRNPVPNPIIGEQPTDGNQVCWGLICPQRENTPIEDRVITIDDTQCNLSCSENPWPRLPSIPNYYKSCDRDSDCPGDTYCCPTGFCGSSDEECFENVFLRRILPQDSPPSTEIL